MPSERFYKLSEDKQDRIVDASIDEFAKEGYQDASINKIIKDADISRGSFYTYFVDKEDLFRWLFGKLKKAAANSILESVRKNDGDIFAAAKQLVRIGMKLEGAGPDKSFKMYDKLMTDFGIMKHIGSMNKGKPDFSEVSEMIDLIYDSMDDLKDCITRTEMGYLCDALITISVKALITVRNGTMSEELALNTLFYQYDIMEKGIRGGRE